jgi:hypothetical protein
MSMVVIQIKVGRLLCRNVRDFLAVQKVMGRNVEYVESSGFVMRTFTISGNNDDMVYVKKSLQQWVNDNAWIWNRRTKLTASG